MIAAGLAVSFCWGSNVVSLAGETATVPHRHDAMEIDSPPIISKYAASLVRPRRMLVHANGTMYIADWGAGTVVRISPKGKSTVIATDLNEPAGMALDGMGNLYVATHAQGMTKEGAIVRLSPNGMKSEFAVGFNGPTGIAFDRRDNLYVANFHDNSISRVNSSGEVSTYVTNIPSPSAIVFDSDGNLLALSATEGSIYRITAMDDVSAMVDVSVIARGLTAPSDLTFHPDGHLIAVNFGRAELVHITPKGRLKVFAFVPKGTVAAGFDRDGNLLVANWDDHTLLKITTNLKIKCPHCGAHIPVRLRVRQKQVPTEPPSSSKPMPPVI